MTNNKLMNPMVDFAFKALFGKDDSDSRELLISFLNAIIKQEDKIKKIISLNTYKDSNYEEDKLSIMDLKVETNRNKVMYIGLQVNPNENYKKKNLYHWSKLYSGSLGEDHDLMDLKKCILINILNFTLFEEIKRYHTEFKVEEMDENIVLDEDFEIHYLELGKFNEKHGHKTEEEQWLTFMKYANDENKKNVIKELEQKSDVINKAMKKLRELSADEKQRFEYLAREKALRDKVSGDRYLKRMIEKIKEETSEEIRKLKEKERIEKIKLVLKLLDLNMEFVKIKEISELEENKIKDIAENIDHYKKEVAEFENK
ncbi:MAG: Rpn family recombination-promoting nuclease/putative transposase [Peptostreptococcaceae bacterium]|nr:Rpn family recombination-promoting nuclease/putative transposase [Peptostreptococcaceae bacterium]